MGDVADAHIKAAQLDRQTHLGYFAGRFPFKLQILGMPDRNSSDLSLYLSYQKMREDALSVLEK